jgi:hypothetical protein
LNTFGVWIIREVISKNNDGIFDESKNSSTTENTLTVIRAFAR